jgi:CheY-like chemotaxis protein
MKKYLLIDDEEIFNYIQSEVIHLHDQSNEVIMFASGAEALSYLKELITQSQSFPDFILLDIRMPNMNGFEFLEELMKFDRQVFNKTRIYLLSSSIDERDIKKAMDYPFVKGFKGKPLSEEIIIEINKAEE